MSGIELDYGAISIDTSIFDNYGIALEKGLLRELSQFKGSPVAVIFPDVVHNEVSKHLTEKIKEARSKISKALKSSQEQLLITHAEIDKAKKMIFGAGTDLEVAQDRINKFYNKIGAQLVPAEGNTNVARLVDSYFGGIPPFEKTGDKKNEFPDAIALLTLESWAKCNKTKVLVVSSDKGWKKFSETSNLLDVFDNLADAIEHFQPHTAVNKIIAAITEDFLLGGDNHILAAITNAISDSLDLADIFVDASSVYIFEEEDVYATYIEHDLLHDGENPVSITVVRVESKMLVLQLTASVKCEVHADFNLYIRDSIDKDYCKIGSTSCISEEEYETDILVTLHGDFSAGFKNIKVGEVEVFDTVGHVDFGEIEMDWGYEE